MVDQPVIGRRYSRLTIDLAVDLVRPPDVRQRVYTRDLSAGGFLYVSDEPVPAGEEFKAILDLPTESEPLHLRALVRHSRPVAGSWRHQVGVEFAGLDEFTRARIQKFIDRFSEIQKAPKETFKPLGLDRGS